MRERRLVSGKERELGGVWVRVWVIRGRRKRGIGGDKEIYITMGWYGFGEY